MMSGLLLNFIFGHSEGHEKILIYEVYMRPQDVKMKNFAESWIHGEDYRNKPVYVLVSGKTGSAAEAFSFGLKNHKRATLIGETTAGAGHPTSFHIIDHDILFMCSIGRTYDPNTNKGIETIGVTPDIRVSSDEALNHAISLIESRSS